MFFTAHANWDSAKSVSTKDKEVQGEEEEDDDEKEWTKTFIRMKEDVFIGFWVFVLWVEIGYIGGLAVCTEDIWRNNPMRRTTLLLCFTQIVVYLRVGLRLTKDSNYLFSIAI